MEELKIECRPDGTVKIEAIGFEGPACEEATRELEAALGVVTDRELKPEHAEVTERQTVGSGR